MKNITKKYTLCDNFFHSAFGGSFLNHIWLIAAASPVFPKAPVALIAQLDASGNLIKDGAVTPDGYIVNTSFSVNDHIRIGENLQLAYRDNPKIDQRQRLDIYSNSIFGALNIQPILPVYDIKGGWAHSFRQYFDHRPVPRSAAQHSARR